MAALSAEVRPRRCDLGLFAVVVPIEGQNASKQPVNERNRQALAITKRAYRIKRIVVGFGIERTKDWWFIRSDANHTALPLGNLILGGLGSGLDLGKQRVVVALQHLMIARLPAEVEHKLQCADHGHGHANRVLWNREGGHDVADSRGAKDYHQEVEHPVQPFERPAACGVVERVAQDIEPDVLAISCHRHFFVGGGAAGGGADGWRGPYELSGWRAPSERCSFDGGAMFVTNVVCGCRGPMPKAAERSAGGGFFSVIPIVSNWLWQLGMKLPGGAGTLLGSAKVSHIWRPKKAEPQPVGACQ